MNHVCTDSNNPPEKVKLSVCMIVRDEENNLSRCLGSVAPIANELVIVDTGSKDNTVAIAKGFGAKMFQFKWCDDFAAAKNESLKHAKGDWILQIDADEELLPSSISVLKNCILAPDVLYYVVKCDNGTETTAPRFHWFSRLFRRHPRLLYSRSYHESIETNAKKIMDEEPRWESKREPNIVIRHYGYEPALMERKRTRGMRIMENYLKNRPNDPYILAKLGGIYGRLGRYRDAKYLLIKALKNEPHSWEANYNLALVLLESGDLDGAIQLYKECLSIDSSSRETHNYLGVVYAEKGWLGEAINEFQQALAIDPSFAEAHNNLGTACGQMGIEEKAITAFKQALAIDPNFAEAHKNLAVAFLFRGEYDLAFEHSEKAVQLGFEVPVELIEAIKKNRKT